MRIPKSSGFVPVALAFGSPLATRLGKPIRTQAGMVQGVEANGIAVYKGIPFAAPPVGNLRWRAPEAAPPWSGVRSADKFAPSCTRTEDCLYLNVWTPAKSPNDRLAVMVWISGGGLALGSTSTGLYDGTNLAKKGVVVVSVAYRLGALGFMTHPQLTAEQGGHSGNYGLLDMIAGLQWVKHNIAAFGGNPNRVTLFGQSAGSVAVSMLAASPLAKGLFQGAISESGGNFGPARQENEPGISMYSVTPDIAHSLGLSSASGALVTQVVEGSAAERAGIRTGDVITAVNGHAVKSNSELRNTIGLLKVGDRLEIGLLRDGKPLHVTAQLAEGADSTAATPGAAPKVVQPPH